MRACSLIDRHGFGFGQTRDTMSIWTRDVEATLDSLSHCIRLQSQLQTSCIRCFCQGQKRTSRRR